LPQQKQITYFLILKLIFMKKFTTLTELFEATKGHQLSAQELINRRSMINGEWQNFEVSDELSEEINDKIIEVLGGQHRTKNTMYNVLRRSSPQHWGLGRIFIEKYGDSPIRFSYCAGQDYPAELAQIRKYLSK
jgi:hypothetical protein